MKFLSSKRGFTLIELLVVIAIIGILASVVLASLNSARAKSRDTARAAEANEAAKALQVYYTQNGNYGFTGSGCLVSQSPCWSGAVTTNSTLVNNLSEYWSFPAPSHPSVTDNNGTYIGMMAFQSGSDFYVYYGNETGTCVAGELVSGARCRIPLN